MTSEPLGRPSRPAPPPAPEPPPALLQLGDRRGLTALGAVVVAFVVGGAGAWFDLATGDGLRSGFAVAFVAGCVLAALTAHREDLRAVVVMPPLLYLVLAVGGGLVDSPDRSGSVLSKQVVALANTVVLQAPVLLVATGATALVAVVRALVRRRR